MKARTNTPMQWITLPIHPRKRDMKAKQIILFSLVVIASCAAVFIFAPAVMAKDQKSVLNPPEAGIEHQEMATHRMPE